MTRSRRPFHSVTVRGQIPPSRPSGLPQAIDLQPGDAVPDNRHLTLPFASHPVDDFRSRNRCLTHCALHNLAALADLAPAFGISPRTVMRARQRLQREGEAGFNKVHKRRRCHGIEDPGILQRATRMLAGGTSLRRTARELDFCYATLRTYGLKGLLPSVDEDPQASVGVEPETPPAETDAGTVRTPALGRERRNRRDAQAPQGRATHDTRERVDTSLGGRSEREPRFPSPALSVPELQARRPAALRAAAPEPSDAWLALSRSLRDAPESPGRGQGRTCMSATSNCLLPRLVLASVRAICHSAA